MTLSVDEYDYIAQIIDRARNLIRTGVWEGIKEHRLDDWLGCLRNFDAELLAAYLLDNLTFRSRDQYLSLLDTLFADLPMPPNSDGTKPAKMLLEGLQLSAQDNPTGGVRIAPVIGHMAPPTKSGPYILRLAQRRHGMDVCWLTWPHLLEKAGNITDLYFLDDICGTGDQFDEFLKSINFTTYRNSHPNLRVNYLVTTIHKRGFDHISKTYPYIKLRWAEHLSAVHSVLSPECFDRYRVEGFAVKIRDQYERVITEAGFPEHEDYADGYGQLGLAYGFAHATPDNTLPIFWKQTPKLTPLLDR